MQVVSVCVIIPYIQNEEFVIFEGKCSLKPAKSGKTVRSTEVQ